MRGVVRRYEYVGLPRRWTGAVCDSVMPGLVPAIHVVLRMPSDVDGRDKPGHDDLERGERSTPIVSSDCPPRGDWAARAAGVFVLSATCPQ